MGKKTRCSHGFGRTRAWWQEVELERHAGPPRLFLSSVVVDVSSSISLCGFLTCDFYLVNWYLTNVTNILSQTQPQEEIIKVTMTLQNIEAFKVFNFDGKAFASDCE